MSSPIVRVLRSLASLSIKWTFWAGPAIFIYVRCIFWCRSSTIYRLAQPLLIHFESHPPALMFFCSASWIWFNEATALCLRMSSRIEVSNYFLPPHSWHFLASYIRLSNSSHAHHWCKLFWSENLLAPCCISPKQFIGHSTERSRTSICEELIQFSRMGLCQNSEGRVGFLPNCVASSDY